VSGRRLAWAVLGVLLLALAGQSVRLSRRLSASVTLSRAERASLEAVRRGRAGAAVLREALHHLERAAERDPLEVGIPIAIGSIHLVLDAPEAALAAYRKAEQLEARPEIYLNRGRAQLKLGQVEAARESFALALKLDPLLLSQVPESLRPPGR
jgi:tetratricopeptide (TPR) repeat protein